VFDLSVSIDRKLSVFIINILNCVLRMKKTKVLCVCNDMVVMTECSFLRELT